MTEISKPSCSPPPVFDPMSRSPESSPDWNVLSRPRTPRQRVYYYDPECILCRKLEGIAPEPEDGDEEKYLLPSERVWDEFRGDEGLKLRFIRYRKSMTNTGGFDVECPPEYPGSRGLISPLEHYVGFEGLGEKAERSVQFVIDTYNEKKKRKVLERPRILKTAGYSPCGGFVIYITFECSSNAPRPQGTENPSSNIYRAVVCCDRLSDAGEEEIKQVMIFRDSNGKDLLDPNKMEARCIEFWKTKGKDRVGNPPEKRKFESDDVMEG